MTDAQNMVMSREEVTRQVQEFLSAYCAAQYKIAQDVGGGYPALWREIDRCIEAGGKRIRPFLVVNLYQAYGGHDVQSIIPIASAWELLHASVLIHDDIIDRDLVRHGQSNVAGRYLDTYGPVAGDDAGHYADSAALLAGDLLISAAHDAVYQSSLSADQKIQVSQQLHEAMMVVAGGELLDVEAALYPIDRAQIEAIAQYKTAGYSFQSPMKCGASLAGAASDELGKLDKLGLELGIVFQLVDDLLGAYGVADETGKPVDSDIREKKRTLLVQAARKNLDEQKSERLRELYDQSHPLSDTEIDEIRQLLDGAGARAAVEAEVADRVARAKTLIDDLSIDTEYKDVLHGLLAKLQSRKS